MTDKVLTTCKEFKNLHVWFNISSFSRDRKQLSEKEVVESCEIAPVRIHIERTICRIKSYRKLYCTFSIKSVKKMKIIFKVIGALCNLKPRLIKDYL